MSYLNDFLLNLPLPLLDHWGYLIVFLSAMVEALPAFGSFFPGHTVVLLSGFLAQMGILRLDAVIIVASIGAIIGDLLGYIIGWKYGHDFVVRYGKYFFFKQEKYEKTKQLVNEHVGKTLIIGRFNTFTRAFAPFIAGISRIKLSKFIIYDILGGVAWAASSVLIGYIFGQGFETASKYFGRIMIIGIISIILIILGYRFLNKRKHIFAKFHIYYLILNALSIYVFSKMVEDYFNKEAVYGFDIRLDKNILEVWQPWLTKLMIFISDVFSPAVLLAAALAAVVYFLFKKKLYKAGLIFVSAGGGLVLGAILKILINRPRPLGGLVLETGLSLPSQHALMATIFFFLVMFFFTKEITIKPLKYLFVAGNIFLILLIGFSRIYLRVHWFSDVIAGLAIGLFWVTFLILVFRISLMLFDEYPDFFNFFKKNSPK